MSNLHLLVGCFGVVCWTVVAGMIYVNPGKPRWLGFVGYVCAITLAAGSLYMLLRPLMPEVLP